jgi:7,8-dihydropterin-6-yl-methyl-4-(beta-D-ribofuranosyl)aminobenzene 5'-phosphate synthase
MGAWSMKISMLIDDKRSSRFLKKEHGLSLYIETVGRKILFDTGSTGTFIDNAAKMEINLKDIDLAVISHAHKDHSGGLMKFLELNNQARVLMRSEAIQQYYIKLLCLTKNISAPAEIFTKYRNRVCFIDNFTELGDNIFVVTNFIRRYPLLRSSKNLLVRNDRDFVRDNFEHELALVINNDGKLVIICGCSHNGIENMIEAVIEYFPGIPIGAVIGGFHLMDFPKNVIQESKEDIIVIGKRLGNYKIDNIYTCHCTGNRAFGILKEVLGNKIDYFYTGMHVEL